MLRLVAKGDEERYDFKVRISAVYNVNYVLLIEVYR